jgi:ribose 5-phosphate isomerase B
MKEKLAIACDHGGYALKEAIKARLADSYDFLDLGAHSTDSVDYPAYGKALALAVAEGRAARGIAICGSGIGISIAANRHPKIRAALCTDSTMARLTRLHNDANVLALGARITGVEVVFDIVDTFLKTEFEGGRHEKRVAQLCSID